MAKHPDLKPVPNPPGPAIKEYVGYGWYGMKEYQELMCLLVFARNNGELDALLPEVAAVPEDHPDKQVLIQAGKKRREEVNQNKHYWRVGNVASSNGTGNDSQGETGELDD